MRPGLVGAIDNATSVRLYKQHSARGYNSAEPYPLPQEPPTLVKQAINVHLHEHGYTPAELARAVRLSPAEFHHDLLGERYPGDNVISMFSPTVA